MKQGRLHIATFLCLNPAVLILAGLLNGILFYFFFRDGALLLGCSLSIFSIFILFLLMKFLHSDNTVKAVAKFATFSLVGWLVAFSSCRVSMRSYSAMLPRSNCAAEIKVRFNDTTDPGDDVEWLSHPNSITADVLELRISQNDKWQQSSGSVLLKFPHKRKFASSNITPLNYGDTAILQGAFFEPDGAVFQGDFDYKLYLKTKGISKIYHVSSLKKINTEPPMHIYFMQSVLGFRNKLMCMMTDGMAIANRKILAALMFGCRYGLDYKSRRTFLQSGVIHIFAISGLHVGMIALALFMLLRWVPFRLRYLIVPCFLAIYVITTGMHASAMRALLMISVWSFMKAFLFRTSALNIVFLTASFLLILNPMSLFGAGFQFSFVIAGFLVFAWGSVNEWLLLMHERSLWIPRNCSKFRSHVVTHLKNLTFNSLATSSIAWLSGSAILLAHRSLFIPGAVVTNFIIIPFVWMLFLVAVFDILLLPFYKLFTLNPVMEFFLNTITVISTAGAEWGGGMNILSPPWYLIVIFFATLLLFLTARRKMIFLGSSILLIFLCLSLFMAKKLQQQQIALFNGGESQEPAVVFIPPNDSFGVTVINPGPNRRAKSILSFLFKNGVNSVDYLIFSENRKSCCEAAWLLLSSIEVKHIIFPSEVNRSRYAKFAMKKALESGGHIIIQDKDMSADILSAYRSPLFKFTIKPNSNYQFDLKTPIWNVELSRSEIMQGEKAITIITPSKKRTFLLKNTSILSLQD